MGQAKVAGLLDETTLAAQKLAALREGVGNVRRLEAQIMAVGTGNANEVERLIALWPSELKAARLSIQGLTERYADDKQPAALVATQQQQLDQYTAVIAPVLDKLKGATIDGATAMAYAGQAQGKVDALVKSNDDIQKAQAATQANHREVMAARTTPLSMLRLTLVALALLSAVPLLWVTLNSVCGPIEQAVRVAARIAQGDLSHRADVHGQDETAYLLRSLYSMQDALRSLVGQVREAADSIHSASSDVASGNFDLRQRTEQTSGSLQRAASSIEQVTGTVNQGADFARQANQLAASAADVAQRGGVMVSQVVTTMNQINASSKKIADIIGTIDGIAFQTNILALHAAVEAARASEPGRGFAVVASEVRSLAGRSAEAAREIKRLIGASVDSVETGARLVANAGSTMSKIVASVQRVSDIIGEITHAANEQSQDIGQVNDSVPQLDQMTQ